MPWLAFPIHLGNSHWTHYQHHHSLVQATPHHQVPQINHRTSISIQFQRILPLHSPLLPPLNHRSKYLVGYQDWLFCKRFLLGQARDMLIHYLCASTLVDLRLVDQGLYHLNHICQISLLFCSHLGLAFV
jgi:hypothetical protein